ncbi:beta-phosphoglucomutase family hydrolase [Steroidobacter cummioxidans]|uniref:beta-phosphoglucomutase family hydrolase n=1 Tax=Steroidobacter cummioxidans TaxID=1803913 RepID=UPI0019D42F43|nr:beta-phosphoglucomutase family hydrolase [Steroidobacter cummioxidans]
MSATSGLLVTVSPRDFDAVLFDLDGVLTPTAAIHAAAWKRMFDDFLRHRSEVTQQPCVDFDIASDYRRYVDGRPRHEGVAAFLASREIALPLGDPDDAPGEQTIHALGNLKDGYFMQHLEQHGVTPFEGAAELAAVLHAQGIKTAVVSSSNNAAAVLEAARIACLFDERVDGQDVRCLGLRGKPAPDAFLEAARRLGADTARTIVVEDATVGIEAGKAGGFGLLIGVDRGGQSQALRKAGADEVVASLLQIQVTPEAAATWSLVYEDFDAPRERTREALCALGNGYFTTRGAAAWARADGVHYPGTYLAGGYNRLCTDIAGRVVENEDLVNFPNWLLVQLRLDTADWFNEQHVRILSYRQELDLQHGVLSRTLTFEDQSQRRSTLRERRLVSMAEMHLAALEITVTAENWSGPVTVRSAIDGHIVNAGAKLYEKFNNRHLQTIGSEQIGDDTVLLHVRTSQSNLHVVEAARTRLFRDERLAIAIRRELLERDFIGQEIEVQLAAGETLTIEKMAVLYSSRDAAISEPVVAARNAIMRAGSFAQALDAHSLAWSQLWRSFDLDLHSARAPFRLNIPMLLRLNTFHLLQAASLNSIGLDIGVPARGWTGEGYQGHIFWDELFIFPTLALRQPEITRSLLMYRYKRLSEAREAARRAGFKGAMFPWQSGSDGQEETQELNLNPHSQRWVPDNSFRQRHVSSAIAWNVWEYVQITDDLEFLQFYGAELYLEIARFWASIATYNETRGRYEIHGVMGPDEFHEGYPDSSTPGVDNNAYTNVMAAWILWHAQKMLDLLPPLRRAEIASRLRLSTEEIVRWDDISRRMFVPFHDDGIISQFEGYEALAELDWEAYRKRYGNVQRLELILEAENDSANRYKLAKQADVLMLFYVFSTNELCRLFARLGYSFDPATIPRIVAYYDARSSHGSTLSRVVHAWVQARCDRPKAITYFSEALLSDVSDIQGGTTAEGIHLGAMAGTVDLVQRVCTGIDVAGGMLKLDPRLPDALDRLDLRIRYRGHTLDLSLTHEALTVRGREPRAAPIKLGFREREYLLPGGGAHSFDLRAHA